GVEHRWVPSTAFCLPDGMQERIGEKEVGLLMLMLDGTRHRFVVARPEGLRRNNILDHPELYPGGAELRGELGTSAVLGVGPRSGTVTGGLGRVEPVALDRAPDDALGGAFPLSRTAATRRKQKNSIDRKAASKRLSAPGAARGRTVVARPLEVCRGAARAKGGGFLSPRREMAAPPGGPSVQLAARRGAAPRPSRGELRTGRG